jgi:uncharacterized protein (DUF885 family)
MHTHRSPTFALADALVEEVAAASPCLATLVGVPGHDHRWDDLSPAGFATRRAVWARALAALQALPPTDDGWDRLARDVMTDHARSAILRIDAGDPGVDLNPIATPLQELPMTLDVMPCTTPEERDRIRGRLIGLDAAWTGLRATYSEALAAGRSASKRQVRAVLDQIAVHVGPAGSLPALAARCDAAVPGDGPALRAAAARAVDAFAALGAWLEERYLPQATDHDAVGPDRYARAASHHLGAPFDAASAEEAWRWGCAEVDRIEAEMRTLAASIAPGVGVAEVIRRLHADPDRCAPTADAFLDQMRARQQQALDRLDGVHFDVPPGARRLDVRLAPPGSGPIGACYLAPSADFSRPGTILYQLERATQIPVFDEVSTAYHEGFPGHHLQLSIQVALADRLCRFHRLFAACSGYAEGWALYAEHLMHELGFLETPELVLGMHMAQLVRAWRVVVDIGLHLELPVLPEHGGAPGEVWSYARAVEVMHRRAFLTPATAASEVVRYLGWPGQAITYKLGQRTILGLRDASRRRADFDLRAFHRRVLEVGGAGLGVLERHVLAAEPEG